MRIKIRGCGEYGLGSYEELQLPDVGLPRSGKCDPMTHQVYKRRLFIYTDRGRQESSPILTIEKEKYYGNQINSVANCCVILGCGIKCLDFSSPNYDLNSRLFVLVRHVHSLTIFPLI